MTLRRQMARHMTEDELLLAITEAATLLGWRWHHFRRSDKGIQMGHTGFPDLVLAKGGRVLFLELKAQEGHVTSEQLRWLQALPDALVVRPWDLDAVIGHLEGRPATSEDDLFRAYGMDPADPYTKAGGLPRPSLE